jgi:hypothetical protein
MSIVIDTKTHESSTRLKVLCQMLGVKTNHSTSIPFMMPVTFKSSQLCRPYCISTKADGFRGYIWVTNDTQTECSYVHYFFPGVYSYVHSRKLDPLSRDSVISVSRGDILYEAELVRYSRTDDIEHIGQPLSATSPLVLVFDCLYMNGQCLRSAPFWYRWEQCIKIKTSLWSVGVLLKTIYSTPTEIEHLGTCLSNAPPPSTKLLFSSSEIPGHVDVDGLIITFLNETHYFQNKTACSKFKPCGHTVDAQVLSLQPLAQGGVLTVALKSKTKHPNGGSVVLIPQKFSVFVNCLDLWQEIQFQWCGRSSNQYVIVVEMQYKPQQGQWVAQQIRYDKSGEDGRGANFIATLISAMQAQIDGWTMATFLEFVRKGKPPRKRKPPRKGKPPSTPTDTTATLPPTHTTTTTHPRKGKPLSTPTDTKATLPPTHTTATIRPRKGKPPSAPNDTTATIPPSTPNYTTATTSTPTKRKRSVK